MEENLTETEKRFLCILFRVYESLIDHANVEIDGEDNCLVQFDRNELFELATKLHIDY